MCGGWIRICPTRDSTVGLADATYLMLPLPVPVAPSEIVNQDVNDVAVHGASGVAYTATLPYAPLGDAVAVSGLIVSEAVESPSCTMVKIADPTETVPVRRAKLGLELIAKVRT